MMKTKLGVLVVLTAMCTLGDIPSASALTIGLDAVHWKDIDRDLSGGSEMERMRYELETAGYSLKPLNDFEPATLSECDAVFVRQPRSAVELFSATEIANINSYVAQGGGLLAISDGGYSTDLTVGNFHVLLSPYGVRVNGTASEEHGHLVSAFVEHPITVGLTGVELNYQRRLVSIEAPALDLTPGGGDDDMLAAVDGVDGAGNVVIISDSAPFMFPGDDTHIYRHSNLLLLLNIAQYTTAKTSTVLTIGLDAVHFQGVDGVDGDLGGGQAFQRMRYELELAGYVLKPLNNFAPATLSGCDAIFVRHPMDGDELFTAAEIQNINSYVADGGGLLAISDGGYSTDFTVGNFQALVSPYGVRFSNVPSEGHGHLVTDFVAHPVTEGLTGVELNYQRRLVSIEAPALDLTPGDGEDDMLAAVDGVDGAGNVVIISDSAPFAFPGDDTHIYRYTNLLLLLNIAQYTTARGADRPQLSCTQVYESSDVPLPIIDHRVTESVLDVSNSGTIADIDVTLNIDHTYNEDLKVLLISPDGVEVRLIYYPQSPVGWYGNSGFHNIVFDDEAKGYVSDDAPFLYGSYRPPSEKLSNFDGKQMKGSWTLRIEDDWAEDEGTLNAWSLTVTRTGCN